MNTFTLLQVIDNDVAATVTFEFAMKLRIKQLSLRYVPSRTVRVSSWFTDKNECYLYSYANSHAACLMFGEVYYK